jgi:hypothetical protein
MRFFLKFTQLFYLVHADFISIAQDTISNFPAIFTSVLKAYAKEAKASLEAFPIYWEEVSQLIFCCASAFILLYSSCKTI